MSQICAGPRISHIKNQNNITWVISLIYCRPVSLIIRAILTITKWRRCVAKYVKNVTSSIFVKFRGEYINKRTFFG